MNGVIDMSEYRYMFDDMAQGYQEFKLIADSEAF